jgi:hypothetical protein
MCVNEYIRVRIPYVYVLLSIHSVSKPAILSVVKNTDTKLSISIRFKMVPTHRNKRDQKFYSFRKQTEK